MFEWWRQRRREQILQNPFPDDWRAIVASNVGHFAFLDADERKLLEDLSQVFVEEKEFEGCGGLDLTDEIQVTIAANACLLLLGLSHDMYRRVGSILVYPSAVHQPERPRSVFDNTVEVVPGQVALAGEAHYRGPVVLVWDAARRGSRNPRSGQNVVFHEFAHKLDMLDGAVDGTPPLRGSEQLKRWAEVCSKAYLTLRAESERGGDSFMDAYGAVSEAEFFAVATEAFFEQPHRLRQSQPDLYEVLASFYRQDTASRMPRRS
ncbi:MAG: zinc-dependent peptidase [Myxococcales bacterium]|nr:zinc-dependent peptidase [Myxococcales bacterium]MDD9969539.1 zinc-dependent peptidase [Myxococcales bacterium]